MGWIDGISECWVLSAGCRVDWDAWAAVGTAAGVLIALLGPSVRAATQRRRANALFALSFEQDLRLAQARMQTIETNFPIAGADEVSWACEALLTTNFESRYELLHLNEVLVTIGSKEIDLSRWPAAVSLTLAAQVSAALHAVKDLSIAIRTIGTGNHESRWDDFWPIYREELRKAKIQVQRASLAVKDAVRAVRVT